MVLGYLWLVVSVINVKRVHSVLVDRLRHRASPLKFEASIYRRDPNQIALVHGPLIRTEPPNQTTKGSRKTS